MTKSSKQKLAYMAEYQGSPRTSRNVWIVTAHDATPKPQGWFTRVTARRSITKRCSTRADRTRTATLVSSVQQRTAHGKTA